MTVEVEPGTGLTPKQQPVLEATAIPEPADKVTIDGTYTIYIPGVGGTGVVTVNALLAYAALIEGKTLLNLDQTGLAQKGGAVLSSLILTDDDTVASNKVGMGTVDQRRGLRGMRQLWRNKQLYVAASGGDGIWTKDAYPPVLLQQRLLMSGWGLSVVHDS